MSLFPKGFTDLKIREMKLWLLLFTNMKKISKFALLNLYRVMTEQR